MRKPPPVTVSDAVLDSMDRDGWTPAQVRALVAAYRELMQQRERVFELVQRWQDSESPRRRQCAEELFDAVTGAP